MERLNRYRKYQRKGGLFPIPFSNKVILKIKSFWFITNLPRKDSFSIFKF